MIVALIILGAIVVVGAVLYVHHILTEKNAPNGEEAQTESNESPECCGMHITCEKDSLLAGVSTEIEYYDDEELDAFKGREPDDYTSEEIDQFRDVLLTLLPQDIAGWGRSIQLRGINLPYEVREELLMIVAEARQKQQ